MKKEYQELQDKQYKLLNEYPYSKVTYYVIDDDKIIDIMSLSEIDNIYESLEDICNLLNKQRNTIQGLKTTKSRMRKDIRKYHKDLSLLKLNINMYYKKLQEEFKL